MLSKMADCWQDVFLTSALDDHPNSFSLWNLKTGSLIKSYKGSNQQNLHHITTAGSDYVLGSQEHKQVIHVWDLKKEQVQLRIVCPEKITTLCCSPDGNYCIVALLDKIYIWQMATGNLMRVLSRHYQNITCLRFTDDGSHFVSGGDDNLVMVWCLSSVLSSSDISNGMPCDYKPMYTWSHHSLPIKDIHITSGGVHSRVLTCSLDQTCKLYDIACGKQVCSFLFDTGLSAVTMDAAETLIFVGGVNGKIHVINISRMRLQSDQNNVNDENKDDFVGHSKEISGLSVSSSGDTLLSASCDHSVRLWHIQSGQCVKQIPFKGKVTNLYVLRLPNGVINLTTSRDSSPIRNFKRALYEPSCGADATDDLIPMKLKNIDKTLSASARDRNFCTNEEDDEESQLVLNIIQEQIFSRQSKDETNATKDVDSMSRIELVDRVKQLETLARTLYSLTAKNIVEDPHSSGTT